MGALDIQQKQTAIDNMKATNDNYLKALTVGPDGKATIDQGVLTQGLASGGHGALIPGILKSVNDAQESVAKLAKTRGEVRTQEEDAGGAVGNAVKEANGDPHLFLTLAQHAIDAKAVDPALLGPVMQHVQQSLIQDPTGETARGNVLDFSNHLINSSPQWVERITQRKAAEARERMAATGEARLPGELAATDALAQERQNKETQQVKTDAVQRLMASPDSATFEKNLNGDDMPAAFYEQARSLIKKGAFDPETSPAVLNRGMLLTPEQVAADDRAKATAERAETNHADLVRHQGVLESQGWTRINDRDNPTPNSTRKDVRQARIEFDKAGETEQKLYGMRSSLANAISSGGKTYVDRLGNVVPMAKAAAADNSSSDALIQDMTDRYKGITERLTTAVLPGKYDAGARLGMQNPSKPLSAAQQELRDGDAALFKGMAARNAPAGAAPAKSPAVAPSQPAKPPAAAAVTQKTEADIRQWAAQNGRDVDAAIKAARQKGIIK